MARFQLHLGFLFSSPFSQRASLDVGEGEESEGETEREIDCGDDAVSSSPIMPATQKSSGVRRARRRHRIAKLATAAAVLRRSLAMCSLGGSDKGAGSSEDIGSPTDVQHVSHVTFDRFDGFLGLPEEFQPDIPSKVPSASISVFGVSAESMKCSHDTRGNSVPTILLSMQRHLYSQGGLKEEGIFRINADNGQEMLAREQLNKGVVPHRVDLHCLAGLIKAWFRELPSGVLDSLTPEQVMHCNRKGECSQLIRMLPPTEAALLDWAINLMADVVEQEIYNKMNARNIAMVFAPNMTQMTDPLIALIHVVQLMNFLNTLIMMTLHKREEEAAEELQSHLSFRPHWDDDILNFSKFPENSFVGVDREAASSFDFSNTSCGKLFSGDDGSHSDTDESFRSFRSSEAEVGDIEFASGRSSPSKNDSDATEGLFNALNLRKGVQKLCWYPVFLLNRSTKKAGELDSLISE
ncbi:hypothetical protein KSP39_PZI000867 [Platanthera zijinensis]|uniref:Uncharacterized protein n=1 Tax=Platanthera zijinensis TaxID=2320716 RepID=A0AAP0C497_9ASPA